MSARYLHTQPYHSLNPEPADNTNNTKLYIYPIKSLRATPIKSGTLTSLGLKYDRRFMLLKVETDDFGNRQLKNMHVPHFPEMALFETSIDTSEPSSSIISSEENDENGDLKRGNDVDSELEAGTVRVTYNPPKTDEEDAQPLATKVLQIPLEPNVDSLTAVNVTMHSSPTRGYDMGSFYNDWFSDCFGYPVILAYLGDNTREVLGSLAPGKQKKSDNGLKERISRCWDMVGFDVERGYLLGIGVVFFSGLPFLIERVPEYIGHDLIGQKSWINVLIVSILLLLGLGLGLGLGSDLKGMHEDRITFADCAPFLVISETSVDDVSARLEGDEYMDRTKFRPNIVISGAQSAFEEDYWTEVVFGEKRVRLLLTGNCVRCQSLNVDYQTGRMGTGEAGSVLKKLMKDRRVDKGARFSPVFGRYSFLEKGFDGVVLRVGDEVEVAGRGEERSVLGEFILTLCYGSFVVLIYYG